MPLVYQQNINAATKLGVWHIAEPEAFFMAQVPLQREITHPNKRLQHLAGRYLLQELYPDFPYNLIRIAATRKPFLQNEAYHFSISHSGAYAAVLISSGYRVGVDVEPVSEKAGIVQHKFLSAAEQRLLKEAVADPGSISEAKLFTTAWSIKESLYKWQGSSEVDFKKHLVITGFHLNANGGIACCRMMKAGASALRVQFLFFEKNCLSWVLSETS